MESYPAVYMPSSSPSSSSKWSLYLFYVSVILFFLVMTRLVYLHHTAESIEAYFEDSFTFSQQYGVRGQDLTGMEVLPASYEGLCGTLWRGVDCSHSMPRLIEYCNMNEPRGEEGRLLDNDHSRNGLKNYELIHLLITIRHGDRTTLNRISGAQPMNETIETYKKIQKYHPGSPLLEPQVRNHLSSASAIKLEYLPTSDPTPSYNPLLPINLFTVRDDKLPPGELTSRGYWQHYRLGSHFNRVYEKFLKSITEPSQIYIRSTNYNRTIQSAAAFIGSFLPFIKSKIKINVFLLDDSEVMHGIGQRLSSKTPALSSSSSTTSGIHTDGGDVITDGSCENAVTFAKKQRDAIYSNPSFNRQITEIFGSTSTKKPVSDIADASLPSICHMLPLPCSSKVKSGIRRCMTVDLLYDALTEGDRLYCSRYAGAQGGASTTKLSLFPFLSEIITILESAVSSQTISESKSNRYGITLFSGHDTVVAPLLAALGVYHKNDFLCRWPSYASRVVFELYKPKSKTSLTISDYMVRVTFNGIDVTSFIPHCKDDLILVEKGSNNLRKVNANSSRDSMFYPLSLCPLYFVKKQVRSLIYPHHDISSACKPVQ